MVQCLIVTWLVPRETAAVSACSVYTIQQRTMSRHLTQKHIRKMHACLAVTRHLHFWQNGWDLLRAGGTDIYCNFSHVWSVNLSTSQCVSFVLFLLNVLSLICTENRPWRRKFSVSPLSPAGIRTATFHSRVRCRCNHWAIPASVSCSLVFYSMHGFVVFTDLAYETTT